ncbi:aldehyde dehydrogenase family protein [Mycolicibacterium thermoresistibile]|uniref:Aldehyde dehydrogenase n=2 Tax=Mycolicibacterium thermoresistibile TaxID=1797 RepID=G7CHM4_MYCT3|nr:aldehyde dehydrogenase family protein [Mycolicibacterium thermoresistibile]EHI12334.1 aldehyde dehydrogenase [Mycolicibacterium thermoresistibile ATCC 19527]MCV7190957.1 aldehyde dehydrogenase family protein [Mycolicibacterium thermoresistibile]GAT15704.1 aldehyde dehydrogenase [Mycolicibacterium thermoresistibile]SNW16748.1 aldehyde dehydrogenase [Mycolicibacterium thermoresistibile]
MTATSGVDATETATIRNPATGGVAGEVRWTDPADVPRITAGLREAQRHWEARGPKGRAKVLARYAVWLGEHRDEIERLLIAETGKSAVDAAQEVPLILMITSYYIKTMEKALAPETRPASMPLLKIKKITVHHRPRPVVGVIAPWNYPVANALMDAIGALAAGCAVLLKPSERTPLTAELLLRGWLESGAPEVFALAQGAREVSEAVVDNADFIQFTGSTATGIKVMERAARRLTPVSLELGGKDPMIVLEDADIELAANAAVWGAMFNAGQTCVSVERVYVLAPVYEQFVAAVVRAVEKLEVGAGEGRHFGALIDESQLAVTERHVADAVARGAKVLTGGRRKDGPGCFYEPTVLVDVDHSMMCMTEETFGPTLPIMKVSSVAEAVRLANDTPYGLSGSVFSQDVERAREIALQLDCGAVNINDVISNLMATTAPMGGWKTSGIGARFGGPEGLRKYCRVETVVEPRTGIGAGGTYYNNSFKSLGMMNKLLTRMALVRPRRLAK